jgi:hypothetical protein
VFEFSATERPYVQVRLTEPTVSLQNGSGAMNVDMSGLDFYERAVAGDGCLAEHPLLLVAAANLPIVLAIIIEVVQWIRQRREERRLWDPAVVYPYVVPGQE